jgi:hypothetical protein
MIAILCLSFLAVRADALGDYSPAPPDEKRAPPAIWSTELSSDSESPLLDLMQTISGKNPGEKTTRLLNGVVEIHTTDKGVEFVRSDSAILDWNIDTADGDHFFHNWRETSQQAEKFLGPNAAAFMMGLHSVKATGHVIEVDDSLHDCQLYFADQKKAKFISLEGLRLKDVRLSVEREDGQLWIKHLRGVEALLRVGDVKIPLQLREFSRRKNGEGQTVLTFGVIPSAFSPLHALLDPYRVTFTVQKHSRPHQEPTAQKE